MTGLGLLEYTYPVCSLRAVNVLNSVRGKQILDKEEAKDAWIEFDLIGEKNDYVFTQLNGKPINPDKASYAFTKLRRALGLPRVTLHGMRHIHATRFFEKNVHPKIISERLGHSDVRTTMNIYTHAKVEMQAEAARVMDELAPIKVKGDPNERSV